MNIKMPLDLEGSSQKYNCTVSCLISLGINIWLGADSDLYSKMIKKTFKIRLLSQKKRGSEIFYQLSQEIYSKTQVQLKYYTKCPVQLDQVVHCTVCLQTRDGLTGRYTKWIISLYEITVLRMSLCYSSLESQRPKNRNCTNFYAGAFKIYL